MTAPGSMPDDPPRRGLARERLLAAAIDLVRANGFAATSVDDLCRAAGVTKGAFFHHFASKEALGEAAAGYWSETTSALFASAPYHAVADPRDRLLAYVAFRRELIEGPARSFSCLAGALAQETFESSLPIRRAAWSAIDGHAATLEPTCRAALDAAGVSDVDARSLARFTQAALQGAFVLAKAAGDPDVAREAVDQLERYLMLLLRRSQQEGSRP